MDIEKCNNIHADLQKLMDNVQKYIEKFNCSTIDDKQFKDAIIELKNGLKNKKGFVNLNMLLLKDFVMEPNAAALRNKLTTTGGKSKPNVKYISTKTKTYVRMKSGSTVSRTIYHKEGDKKQTKYVKINSEYVKY